MLLGSSLLFAALHWIAKQFHSHTVTNSSWYRVPLSAHARKYPVVSFHVTPLLIFDDPAWIVVDAATDCCEMRLLECRLTNQP
jgi:hypothetical protein